MSVSPNNEWVYTFGPFVLDTVQRTLSCDGTLVALSPKAFDLLCCLVENPDRVLSKDELFRAVWPDRVVEESNLSQTVFTLRKALEARDSESKFIVTAPGRGYRFVGPVQAIARANYDAHRDHTTLRTLGAANAPELVDAALTTTPNRAPQKRSRIFVWAALAIVAVALIYATVEWKTAQRQIASATSATVVLADFQNDANDAVFDRALHKALEVDLAQSPLLNVLSEEQAQETLLLMARAKDAAIDMSLAREICTRNRGIAVVMGTIAAIGQKYLLTLEARACDTGNSLIEEQREVDRKEAIVATLDQLSGDVRAKLGESRDSIARFDAPLLQEKTGSLDALKAYSDGVDLYTKGRRTESIALFRHAIELDDHFAAAYSALGAVFQSVHEPALAAENASKAYALRDGTSERVKLDIVARYHKVVTRDINETVRTLRLRVATYPLDAAAWANLSDAENWIGNYPAAIDAGKKARALEDDKEQAYVVLARALMHANQFAQARDVCVQAEEKGIAGEDVRGVHVEIAYAMHDDAAIRAQVDWTMVQATRSRTVLLDVARSAYAAGQLQRGDALFDQLPEIAKQQGLGNFVSAPRARDLIELGRVEQARTLLQSLPPDFDSPDFRFALMEIGDVERANQLLEKDLQKSPDDTLLNASWAPQARAAQALREGRPDVAIKELASAQPYEMRTFDVPYLRGSAYLAAKQGSNAAAEFRKILDNPGIDPLSPLYTLSQLNLARAERLSGDNVASRRDYETFFSLWKNADEQIPVLLQAHREFEVFE